MRRSVILTAFLSVAVVYAAFQSTPALADPELVVDDDGVECPGAGFTTIQGALNAAPPGAEIRVCLGTYNEQVTISRPVKIKGENGAVLMPALMAANSTSLKTGLPIAAAILVEDTTGVKIEGLTVDGAASGIFCGPNMIGIFYRNASGKIKHVAVRHMTSLPGGEGCQSGLGIFAQSGGGGTSQVEVEDSSVHDYQKNGITGNEPGTEIRVKGNVVTGIGPTTGAAQNGIQIGFGATGGIEENTVINHIWSPCVSVSQCAWNATNILIYDADDVRVAKNTIGKGQAGIYLFQGNNGKIEGNNVVDTDVFDGIVVIGDTNKVEGNTITNSDEAAVFLEGNHNTIVGNTINEAPVGVLKVSGGAGNVIEGNHFANTPTPIVDPLPAPWGGPTPFR